VRTHVLPSAEAAARAAADRLAAAVGERPELVLGLPTGRTPVPFYDDLAFRHQRRQLDLSRARAFNLDELALARGPEDPEWPASFLRGHPDFELLLDPAAAAGLG